MDAPHSEAMLPDKPAFLGATGDVPFTAIGHLAAGIAHEFNNIMTVVTLHTEILLATGEISEESRRRLELILRQAEYATNLIQQILDFGRCSMIEPTLMDMGAAVEQMVEHWRRILPETIDLRCRLPAERLVTLADPARLQQVLTNLIVNARDAMSLGGVLEITLERSTYDEPEGASQVGMEVGPWLKLTIRDTGVGIAPDHLPHIFEPFFTTKPVGKGTGLGLAQVYGIIKQHGGHIEVHSEPGRGATFIIYLALAEQGMQESRAVAPVL